MPEGGPPPGTGPFHNVADYGARGDGRADDTAAIAQAIAAAAPVPAPTGNTVVFPAGTYLVSGALKVPPGVTLSGAGWNTPGSQANTFAGSWICVAAGANFSPVTLAGSGASVRNLGFNVFDQGTGEAPASAPAMVLVTANNTLIENICLYNPYGGVYIDGGAQTVLHRIWGQPLNYGIMIDGSRDTNYIDGVHFWTYWAPGSLGAATYQLANGTAIVLARCDNPHISNVMAYNYNTGLGLSGSAAGIPHKVHLVNADFDGCVTGLRISSPGQAGSAATVQMANVTVQSPARSGAPAGHGIWVDERSAFAMLQVSNLRVSNSGLNAVRIDAANVRFYGENVSLENWRGSEGFHISSPSSVAYLGAGFAAAGPGAPYAPASQFRLAQLR